MIPKPAAVQTFRNKLTNHTQYTEIVDATTYKTKAHIKETVQWYNVQGIQRGAVLGIHIYNEEGAQSVNGNRWKSGWRKLKGGL